MGIGQVLIGTGVYYSRKEEGLQSIVKFNKINGELNKSYSLKSKIHKRSTKQAFLATEYYSRSITLLATRSKYHRNKFFEKKYCFNLNKN